MTSNGGFDTGPLIWVKGEIEQALGRAVAALRAAATTPGDATQIEHCRTHFHQAHGALQIIGLDGVARFSEELEGLFADISAGTALPTAIDVAERCIGAISGYLEQLLAGQPNQPLKLFALYGEIARERGRSSPDPVELYYPDLLPLRHAHAPGSVTAADRSVALRTERYRFMRGFLRWVRQDRDGMHDMQQAASGIGAAESDPASREFWGAADALLAGISVGAISDEAGVPRLCNRIERQIKRLIDGAPGVAERLLREVLYHAARAAPITPELRGVQESFGLVGTIPEAFEMSGDDSSLLPRLRVMRESVIAAKSAWMKYTGGHLHSIGPFGEQVAQMRDRSASLGRAELIRLTEEIALVADRLGTAPTAPSESLSLEVATALLLIEDAVDRFNALPPEFANQCESMIARLANAFQDQSAQPVPASPLLDEMSRRAQERVAIAQVMGEIQTNLREIEAGLDAFFRDQSRRQELVTLEKPIAQVVGAFRILNDEQAERSLGECAEQIQKFISPDYEPSAEELDRLAATLSGLGFYVDGLQHGKADFEGAMRPIRPHGATRPARAEPSTVEKQIEQQQRDTQNFVEAWQSSPSDPSRKEELRQHVETLQHDASLIADTDLERRAQDALSLLSNSDALPAQSDIAEALAGLAPPDSEQVEPSAAVRMLADAPREVIDAELLAVYLEEAGQVIETIDESLNLARSQPSVMDHLRTIRRGFHTLKGSGRMVGLTQLSAAAWAIEKLMNRWLDDERPGNAALLDLIADGRNLFAAAVAALMNNAPLPDEAPVVAKAEAIERGDPVVAISDRRMTSALYQIFLVEAFAHVAALRDMQARLAVGQPVLEEDSRAAHTLAGVCGSVGFGSIREVAAALEEALESRKGSGLDADLLSTISDAVASLEGMVKSVAAREEPVANPGLVRRLQEHMGGARPAVLEDSIRTIEDIADGRRSIVEDMRVDLANVSGPAAARIGDPNEAGAFHEVPKPEFAPVAREQTAASIFAPSFAAALVRRVETLPSDDVDPEVMDLFIAEAQELMPAIDASIRAWRAAPNAVEVGLALQRNVHTLKGSARMAGAMQMGELLHDMENHVENALQLSSLPITFFENLDVQYDAVNALFDRLIGRDALASPFVPAQLRSEPVEGSLGEAIDSDIAEPIPLPAAAGRWSADRMVRAASINDREEAPATGADGERIALLRVRADAIDRLVNQAGEVAIARSRIEGEVKGLKATLSELTENIGRLRSQLREIEIQAETQIQSKMVQSAEKDRQFDPLEFDRYTRFQELTRMMAESVSDVGAVHQNIARALDETDAALLAQARLSRDLQQDLMRVRMVPFKILSERLYRIVRQAAKEAGKRATLDIRGSQVELDRSVLERINAPFEHMLRNAIAHGIESPAARQAAGKPEVGEIRIEIRQEGNEVMLMVADDGGGLDIERIRAKALERGLLAAGAPVVEADITGFIFEPGFTTVGEVTQLAGRGVGMDVVKSEINALGGRIEVATEPGKGTRFIIFLPLTLAVTQAVVVQAGAAKYAIPGLLVELVRQVRPDELAECYRAGVATTQNRRAPFHYLSRLLGDAQRTPEPKRLATIVFARSGAGLVAVHVDEIVGIQEIVVKNTGPLLARVSGITGATVLGSGEIVLILNPVVIAARENITVDAPAAAAVAPAVLDPIVMIVDDSLTVRKITGRLLTREGYHVVTARDGVDAIEQLEAIVPDVMVIDIEMPRMDGFDLTRHIRASGKLTHLPIVMVTPPHKLGSMEIRFLPNRRRTNSIRSKS